jgi:hypothetical protein
MAPVFVWLPYTAGAFYGIRKQQGSPTGWQIPTAFLSLTSTFHAVRAMDVKLSSFPRPALTASSLAIHFGGASFVQTSIFCAGNLFSRIAYPTLPSLE